MQPLHTLLTSSTPKSQSLLWNATALPAFSSTKEALANASLLAYPTADAPTCLRHCCGAVLQQYVDTTWHPISFFFKKMTPAETRYSRKLLAVYLAIRHCTRVWQCLADTLSRVQTNSLISGTQPIVDFVAMAKSQATDPQIQALQSSPSSEPISLPNAGDPLYSDNSTGAQCPLEMASHCVQPLHSLSYPGIRATQKFVSARFVWPGVNADVCR